MNPGPAPGPLAVGELGAAAADAEPVITEAMAADVRRAIATRLPRPEPAKDDAA